MKKIILIVIVLAGIVFFVLNYSSKPTDVKLATIGNNETNVINTFSENEKENEDNFDNITTYEITNFNFEFIGYGPAGKFHEGKIDSEIISNNRVAFNMKTVKTDSEKLNEHLCTDDFFNCVDNPLSYFTLEDIISTSENNSLIGGVYQMKGIAKKITFDAKPAEGYSVLSNNTDSTKYTGEFLLDTSEFDFKVPIVEPEVLIKFEFGVSQKTEVNVDDSTDENATNTDTTSTSTESEL